MVPGKWERKKIGRKNERKEKTKKRNINFFLLFGYPRKFKEKKRNFFTKSSLEPGKGNRLATALVATMTASAKTVLKSVKTLKGVEEKLTLVIVAMKISVPKRRDWARQRSMISLSLIPSGKLGKFSMSEVVVSWPPGAMSLAIQPSKRMGRS